MNTRSLDLEASLSQFASRADTASLSITGNLTIECWVKFESTPSSGNAMAFVSKYNSTGNQRSYFFRLRNNSGTLQLHACISHLGSEDNNAVVDWTPSTGVWYHVAVTYTKGGGGANDDIFRCYVDGTQQGTDQTVDADTIFNSTADFEVGALTGASFLDGKIDEVRVWNTARSQANINTNKSVELVGNEANLQAYYKFSNNYNDTTANANNLTASGSPVFSSDVPFDPVQGGFFALI